MESEIELIRKKLKENRENSELTEILFRSKQFQSLQQKKKGIRPFGHKPQQELIKDYIKQERSPLDKREEPYPLFYKEYQEMGIDFNTGHNIGSKLERILDNVDINRRRWKRSFLYGNFVGEAYLQGKLGVDGYFVIFGVIGGLFIVIGFYQRWKVQREWVREVKGISKEVLKEWEDCEEVLGVDMDDLSLHISFDNQKDHLFQTQLQRNWNRNQMITKLEQELYGDY